MSSDELNEFLQNEVPFEEALRTVIYNAIRTSIRTQYTSMKLCEACDRTIKIYESTGSPANIVAAMPNFHAYGIQLKETSGTEK
jgi:hypothetical protein